jgi:Mor family transcriptional regulator
MARKTTERDREIFAAHKSGQSLPTLAARFGLAVTTLMNIVRAERLKHDVSVEGFYREQRGPQP